MNQTEMHAMNVLDLELRDAAEELLAAGFESLAKSVFKARRLLPGYLADPRLQNFDLSDEPSGIRLTEDPVSQCRLNFR